MTKKLDIEIKKKYSIEAEEAFYKEVKAFGTSGAHIVVPSKHAGKRVLVIVEGTGMPEMTKEEIEKYADKN
jgi:putative transposon-encoded protein